MNTMWKKFVCILISTRTPHAHHRTTVNVGGAVIVKCANPAFTKVKKEVNDFNYNKYPKYVRAYHP